MLPTKESLTVEFKSGRNARKPMTKSSTMWWRWPIPKAVRCTLVSKTMAW